MSKAQPVSRSALHPYADPPTVPVEVSEAVSLPERSTQPVVPAPSAPKPATSAPAPVRNGPVPTVPLMVRVPLELREDLRETAFGERVTMQDAVTEAIRDWLKKVRKRAGS
jgi:hypothetical protein